MDPAIQAQHALNGIFERLEVPCRIEVDKCGAGKYMVATTHIASGTELFEEVPLVSWPSRGFLRLRRRYCWYCLVEEQSSTNASVDANEPPAWSTCSGPCQSSFCSDACRSAGEPLHELLCTALPDLRQVDARGEEDGGVFTMEALARCVGGISVRLAAVIQHQQLTHSVIQEDFVQHGEKGTSIVNQLFTQVSAPYNRLIGAPSKAEFAGVDFPAWATKLRALMHARVVKALQNAAGYADEAEAAPKDWAEAITDALLSDDTLRTFLGLLAVNAHGINTALLRDELCSTPGEEEAAAMFSWVVKGAAVYSLLSSLNHSCDPNVVVMHQHRTNNILVQATRDIAKGEEMCITYIPLTPDSTYITRRAALSGYFFTCSCSRCVAEETKAKKAKW